MRVRIISSGRSIFIDQLIENIQAQDCSVRVDAFYYNNPEYKPKSIWFSVYAKADKGKVSANSDRSNSMLMVIALSLSQAFRAIGIRTPKWLRYTSKPFFIFLKNSKNYLKIKLYFFLMRREKYDLTNIHYIDTTHCYFWEKIKKTSKKTIVTVYGSDFYKASHKQLSKIKVILAEANVITFANSLTRDALQDHFPDISINTKSIICRFGLNTLSTIRHKFETGKVDIKALRQKFGINDRGKVIVIGYSAHDDHRHSKVIDSIDSLDKYITDDLIIVLPMTYGDVNYIQRIKKLISKKSFRYKILTNYLDDEDNANLRLISDIMINVRLTDQLSGSMQESMYAGGVIITGEWLPYETFWNLGAFALKIKHIDQLSTIISDVINNYDLYKKKSLVNRDIIWSLSSWEKNANEWLKLYRETANEQGC